MNTAPPCQTCQKETHTGVAVNFRVVVISWARWGEKGMESGILFKSEKMTCEGKRQRDKIVFGKWVHISTLFSTHIKHLIFKDSNN